MSSRKRNFENYCESKYSVESMCLRDTLECNQFRKKIYSSTFDQRTFRQLAFDGMMFLYTTLSAMIDELTLYMKERK